MDLNSHKKYDDIPPFLLGRNRKRMKRIEFQVKSLAQLSQNEIERYVDDEDENVVTVQLI